jgi:AcrR family transcriptional regulator
VLDESNKQSFSTGVGRIAGVTADQTRERLISAAATCFADKGYEGTRVSEIAAAAGVSNGALYAHFEGKADLLVSAIRDRAPHELATMFLADPDHSLLDLLVTIGSGLPRRDHRSTALVVEALVASRRDADVRRLMRTRLGEQSSWVAGLVREAQAAGEVDETLSPEAIARLCMVVVLGSALVPDRPSDEDAWTALVSRVANAIRPPAPEGTPA